jgi:hypothetical protein
MENLMSGAADSLPSIKFERIEMKEMSKALKWLCLTILVAAGMKYVPAYLVQQRQMDVEDRVLDLREEAFLQQRVAPTVSTPEPIQANRQQML